jgi:hypothetical protein
MIDFLAIIIMVMAASTLYVGHYSNWYVDKFASGFVTLSITATIALVGLSILTNLSKKYQYDYIALMRSKIVFTIASFAWIMFALVLSQSWTGFAFSVIGALVIIVPIINDAYSHLMEDMADTHKGATTG